MKEYKMISDSMVQAQKVLNQWRHDYTIDILHIEMIDRMNVFMLITRTPK